MKFYRIMRLRVPPLAAALIMASFLLLTRVPETPAQQSVTSATVSGLILDTNEAAVGGASVNAVNLDTNQTQTATSDEEGRYRLPYLRVKAYRLTVEKAGFATLTKELTLTVGQALDVSLRLTVPGFAESVSVNDTDVHVVETARTQVAETIASKEIDGLPLNGRNYPSNDDAADLAGTFYSQEVIREFEVLRSRLSRRQLQGLVGPRL